MTGGKDILNNPRISFFPFVILRSTFALLSINSAKNLSRMRGFLSSFCHSGKFRSTLRNLSRILKPIKGSKIPDIFSSQKKYPEWQREKGNYPVNLWLTPLRRRGFFVIRVNYKWQSKSPSRDFLYCHSGKFRSFALKFIQNLKTHKCEQDSGYFFFSEKIPEWQREKGNYPVNLRCHPFAEGELFICINHNLAGVALPHISVPNKIPNSKVNI